MFAVFIFILVAFNFVVVGTGVFVAATNHNEVTRWAGWRERDRSRARARSFAESDHHRHLTIGHKCNRILRLMQLLMRSFGWCVRQIHIKTKNKKKKVQRSMDSRRWNKNNHHSALSHTCCAHLEGFCFTRQSRGRQLPYEWERKTVPICNLLVAVWTRALFIRYVLIILFRRITVNRSTVSCDAEDDDYPYQEDTMSCIL